MFIKESVSYLYEKYGDEISNVVVVMPGKRASLFFNMELSLMLEGKPVWQPKFVTLDQLFTQMSGLVQADKVKQLVDLYTVYSKYHNETFDKFYYWGDMLLADFDAIDSYMIDAECLFNNSGDIAEIEQRFDYLEPQDVEEIRRFWSNFRTARNSTEKEYFMSVWKTLFPIYKEFKELLTSQGLSYRGMIYRTVAESIISGDLVFDKQQKYAFVGFNALSSCEKVLFRYLGETCNADFLWDADNFYLQNKEQEAGLFIRNNITLFGDSNKNAQRDNFLKKKNIQVVDAPSNSLQCKYVWDFLTRCDTLAKEQGRELGRETAIVLTDESMLIPVLYAISDVVTLFNVTAGYELRFSTAYMFCRQLISLQQNKIEEGGEVQFYYRDVEALMSHPYMRSLFDNSANSANSVNSANRENNDNDSSVDLLDEILDKGRKENFTYYSEKIFSKNDVLATIFNSVKGWKALSDYLMTLIANVIKKDSFDDLNIYSKSENREFAYRLYEAIRSLTLLIDGCGIEFSEVVYISALKKHLSSQRVSFEGEPLVGIQIMGILESRTLDFENVLVLNVNEDNFPSSSAGNSFIPSNLRHGYGLPTLQYQEAMYSYYFYRLLQRAVNIDLAYVSSGDEMSRGEPSRYIRQLQYSPYHDIKSISLSIDINNKQKNVTGVPKTLDIHCLLHKYTNGKNFLSPSAMFNYIECPMKFYYRYVEGLKVSDEDKREAEFGALEIGNVVHHVVENIYRPLIAMPHDKIISELQRYNKDMVEKLVLAETEKEIGGCQDEFTPAVHNAVKYMVSYALNIIRYDIKRQDDFTVVGIEQDVKYKINVNEIDVWFKGNADRVDCLASGVRRLIDYKSGAKAKTVELSTLFTTGDVNLKKPVFQALLYCFMWSGCHKDETVPSLYYTRQMNNKKYSDKVALKDGKEEIELNRYSQIATQFESMLKDRLCELFDRDKPFYKTTNDKVCEYCEYKALCDTM